MSWLWLWRGLLLLVALGYLLRRCMPMRWRVWHQKMSYLAWVVLLVFAVAALWRLWNMMAG